MDGDSLDSLLAAKVELPPGVLGVLLRVGLPATSVGWITVAVDGSRGVAAIGRARLCGLAATGHVAAAGKDLNLREREGMAATGQLDPHVAAPRAGLLGEWLAGRLQQGHDAVGKRHANPGIAHQRQGSNQVDKPPRILLGQLPDLLNGVAAGGCIDGHQGDVADSPHDRPGGRRGKALHVAPKESQLLGGSAEHQPDQVKHGRRVD